MTLHSTSCPYLLCGDGVGAPLAVDGARRVQRQLQEDGVHRAVRIQTLDGDHHLRGQRSKVTDQKLQ